MYEAYLQDLEWWFPPQRVHLSAHDDLEPEAEYFEYEVQRKGTTAKSKGQENICKS